MTYLKELPDILAPHLNTIITCLLNQTIYKKEDCIVNDLKVRLEACKVLQLIPCSFEYALLHPYKTLVLKELLIPIDDHKRIVRKEGSSARNKWFLLSPLSKK